MAASMRVKFRILECDPGVLYHFDGMHSENQVARVRGEDKAQKWMIRPWEWFDITK